MLEWWNYDAQSKSKLILIYQESSAITEEQCLRTKILHMISSLKEIQGKIPPIKIAKKLDRASKTSKSNGNRSAIEVEECKGLFYKAREKGKLIFISINYGVQVCYGAKHKGKIIPYIPTNIDSHYTQPIIPSLVELLLIEKKIYEDILKFV